jgi:hypothetical protein
MPSEKKIFKMFKNKALENISCDGINLPIGYLEGVLN